FWIPGSSHREVANVRLDVIASAAKQSISPRKGRMDCFASLAMTVSCDHRATLSGRHHPQRRLRIYLRPHPRVTASPLSLEELAKRASRRRVWDRRHCERSEAIHSFFARRDGLLRFARNDGLMLRPSKRLAEKFRTLQTISPRQLDRFGNADPQPRD